MTRVDWIALAIAALAALSGLRRGLVATALSFAGLAVGAIVGARLAPHVLDGGAGSPYTPVAGLVGALIGAAVLQSVAGIAGSFARGGLAVIPPLKALDSMGGLIVGAALGLGLVWVAGAVLLQLPGQTSLRAEVQQSTVLQQLNEIAPPRTVLRALSRVDPFPQIAGPMAPLAAPDNRALASATVTRAQPSVVRITATACGLGVEGSGWVARPQVVVTAAHVVAGGAGIRVDGFRGAGARRRPQAGHRSPARAGAARAAAAARRRAPGRLRRDPRLSAERPVRRAGPAASATPPTCSSAAASVR